MTKQEIIQKLAEYEKGHSVEFDEKEHVYKIDGEFFAGVSSIVEERAKNFLTPWAAKEAVKFLGYEDERRASQVVDMLIQDGIGKYQELLSEAKGRWIVLSNQAKVSGQLAHDYIENHIKGQTLLDVRPENDDANRAIDAFLEWEKERKPEWIVSEKIVFSLAHKFAGTLDALCFIDGRLSLVDIKTSKQLSESYALQTAAYDICLFEAGIITDNRTIIRLPKDGKKAEECEVGTNLEFDKETFLHLRAVRKWNTDIQNNYTTGEGYNKRINLNK